MYLLKSMYESKIKSRNLSEKKNYTKNLKNGRCLRYKYTLQRTLYY